MRKIIWLTIDDVDDHFAELCVVGSSNPAGDTARFIHTFGSPGGNTDSCFGRLAELITRLRGGTHYAD